MYVELNQQIAALLNTGEEEEVVELKSLQQQLSDVCYRQAAQLENRQNVLQAAQGFHSTTQEVTHTLNTCSFPTLIPITGLCVLAHTECRSVTRAFEKKST